MLKSTLRALVLALVLLGSEARAEGTELTVMCYDVWGGGANLKAPVDETLAVIREVNPDVIGIQETRIEDNFCIPEACHPMGPSVAGRIAKALGYYVYEQTRQNPALWANAILSRYPIGKPTPNDLGVSIDVNGRKVEVYNLHIENGPYQPFQLLHIKYGTFPYLATAEEAVEAAAETRGPALKLLFDDIEAAGDADAAFVLGDFNEPSHRDWTPAAVKAGLQPMVVDWPTVKAVEDKGFVDTFRDMFPDAAAKPGATWTPMTDPRSPEDHHDRIDFALARAPNLAVEYAGIVGERFPEADIVIEPWPSYHRATVAKVKF